MDGGDKCDPLITGKSAKAQYFEGLKKLSEEYALNIKAWRTRAIFSKWLKEFKDKMHHQKRKVRLLLDYCMVHHVLEVQLKSVQLHFFPPNVTSVIHPLDQGVINTVKCTYKYQVIGKLLLNLELKWKTKIIIFKVFHHYQLLQTCRLQSIHCRGCVGLWRLPILSRGSCAQFLETALLAGQTCSKLEL